MSETDKAVALVGVGLAAFLTLGVIYVLSKIKVPNSYWSMD